MAERQIASKSFGKYMILHTIGKGEFGKVKLAYDPQRDLEVAIKFIKRSNITSAQKQAKLEREINILQNLNHPNIVHLYDVIETEKYIGIVMAYANGGELFEYISENQYLSEEESAKFFLQLLDGVQYLHNLHIVHRDLKLENLLLDQNGNIVITDFGFANNSRKNPSGLLSTSCGSPCYAAPELVINDNYVGEAADIWSCGIILYAMLCGYLPFDDDPNNPDGENLDLLYKYILESQLTFPEYISEDAQELVCGMLIPDPEKRWSMEKVLNHRWLRNSRYYKEKMKESMKVDYIYDDDSYIHYINDSSNSDIEVNQEDNKVPDYPSQEPQSNTQSRQNVLDEETEVYDNKNIKNENVDSSIDKTEYIPNQEAVQNIPVPKVENKQSISQATNSQEYMDAQQEITVENTKDQDDMEVDQEQEDKMEIDEPSPVAITPEIATEEDRIILEAERKNAEKQIEKLINEIQQEEFTQLEEMKDQLQEVVKDEIADNIVEEAVEEPKEEIPAQATVETSEEIPIEDIQVKEVPVEEENIVEEVIVEEKPNEEVVIPENTEVKAEPVVQENEVDMVEEEVVIPEVATEKVEEIKEVVVPEVTTEKVEEIKEEVVVPEVSTEKVEEIKEVVVPEVATEKVEEIEERVVAPEVDTEKVEEVKERAVVQEVSTEKVEEIKEESNTLETEAVVEVKEEIKTSETETAIEKVDEVMEDANVSENVIEEVKEEITAPETVTEKVEEIKEDENKETETKVEDKSENPTIIKLNKEDLIEVDDEISRSTSSKSTSTSSSSSSSSEEKTEEKIEEKAEAKEDNKEAMEDVKPEETKVENESEDVEMKEQEKVKDAEVSNVEEDKISMLKKTKKTISKDKKNKKQRKMKNLKIKIKENKVFKKFFGCIMMN